MSQKEIADCPCFNCVNKLRKLQEKPCSDCAAFGVIGYPGFKPIPGLLEPDKFKL
jgi:hypothetical protein